MSPRARALLLPLAAPLVAAAVLATLLAAAPSASAASVTIRDGRGDPAGDITSVRVAWASGLGVRVKHAGELRNGDVYSAYVDTRPGRKGPEYRAFARPNSNQLGLRRISRWGDPGTAVPCRGFRAKADTFDRSAPVSFYVPGGCLGDPDGPVRVTARFQRGDAEDWAPSARRLGPPVRRG